VRTSVPELKVPPVMGAVNPDTFIVPPVLLYKDKIEVAEKYVPPVI
jgi:hypothetical protein